MSTNQETDSNASAAEHDVDIGDLEDRLYAQIHYEIGDNEVAPSGSNDFGSDKSCRRQQLQADDKLRSVSAHVMLKNSSVTSSEKNGGRYWSGDAYGRPSSPKPFYNKKESGVYNTLADQVGSRNNSKNVSARKINNNHTAANAAPSTSKQNSNPIVPSSNKPKVFTPYKPLLSDAGVFSTSNNDNESLADASSGCRIELEIDTTAGLKETSKLIKNRQTNDASSSSQSKRKNPFATLPVEKVEKRLNPFHRMRQENLKVKDKTESKKKKNREKAVASKSVTVNVDDEDDDDEVIILPTEPPPLICIDSSEDDAPKQKRKRNDFAEPGTSKQSLNRMPGNSRCTSPTNSILSADDFILQKDRRRFELEQFGVVPEEDMIEIDRNVKSMLRHANGISDSLADATDAVVFATPHRKKKEKKPKVSAKSYEMGENSFAAVDVYESESSDMPDTIYAKGMTGKRKKISSSSSEAEDEVEEVPKSKRLRKRKSSGSAKGSDFISSDETSSENENGDGGVADTIPYLIRGEAVGKVKKSNARKAKKNLKRKRQPSDKLSDEEFISKLTSIAQGESEASNGDEIDESRETSTDSIAARDIVKSVLQKRSKRAKKTTDKPPPEVADVDEQISNGHESVADEENVQQEDAWAVKDQIGQTDDAVDDDFEINLLDTSTSSIANESILLNATLNTSTDANNQSIDGISPSTITTIAATNVQKQKQKQKQEQMKPANDPSDDIVLEEQTASAENLEMAWNEEMKCFYNMSWGGETFRMGRIQARMPQKFTDWAVANKDKFPSRSPHRNRQNSRCVNCHERGHRVIDCPQPPKNIVCYMCGENGHFEPRCPNRVCLKCGDQARASRFGCVKCDGNVQIQCFVCRLKGHRAADCPDKWRRYHSTTEPAVPLTEREKLEPEKPKYCSICASRGHLADNCRKGARFADGRAINTLNIRSYRDAYNAQPIKQNESQPLYSIFSSNVEDFDFNFGKEVCTKGNTIYGRFAQAVDLKRKKLIATSRWQRQIAPSTIPSAEEAVATTTNSINKNKRTHRFFHEAEEEGEGPEGEEETPVTAADTHSEVLVETETTPDDHVSNETVSDGNNESNAIVTEIEEPTKVVSETQSNDNKQPTENDVTEIETENGLNAATPFDVTGESEISDTLLNVVESTSEINETLTQVKDTERKLDQLNAYETSMKQLREMKEQLKIQNRIKSHADKMDREKLTSSVADIAANCDSDSNYSFSEYYLGNSTKKPEQQPSTSASVTLPDFIPLSSKNDAEHRFRQKTPSPAINRPIKSEELRCEAKVYLTSDHCKYLLTPTGHIFLKDKEEKHDVVIRLEWQRLGNVLCITGTSRGHDSFRLDLVAFFETLDKKIKLRSEVQIPKNRLQLIKHISAIIRELNGLSTNNVIEFYHSMRRYERANTKASNRKAERCRRYLNMTLFGVYGFREGATHLQNLQDNLRLLKSTQDTNVPVKFRQSINKHLNYIFTAHQHNNYDDLIEQYLQLRRSKTLPELNLDRKLLGLSIDVQTNRNASTLSSETSNYILNDSERVDDVPSDQTPAIPSLMDIQLNVSSLVSPTPAADHIDTVNNILLPGKIDGSSIPSVETNQYAFWSEKTLELIEKLKILRAFSTISPITLSSLEKQARNHEAHYNAYCRLFKTLENAIANRNAGFKS